MSIYPLVRLLNSRFSCVIFVLLLSGLSFVRGQEEVLFFEHIGLKEGLPQGQVLNMMQDSEGFIWLSTMIGLFKYNGYDFVPYYHDAHDSTSLSTKTPGSIIEDHQGYLWIGGHRGLNRYDREKNCFKRYYHDPTDPYSLPPGNVETVFEDSRNNLWVGAEGGLTWYDPPYFHRVFHRTVHSMVEDDEGFIWGGYDGGIVRIDRASKAVQSFRLKAGGIDNTAIKLYRDRQGNMWIGSSRGLFVWNPAAEHVVPVSLTGSPNGSAVRDIIEDDRGNLWIATLNDNGIFRYNPTTGNLKHFRFDPANSFGLASNHVRCFTIDNLGQLWIGTYNGLNKVRLDDTRFSFLQHVPGLNHPVNHIFRSYQDRTGTHWFSTYDHRLFRADDPGKKAFEVYLPFKEARSNPVERFYDFSADEIWFIHRNTGMVRYHQKTGKTELVNLPETIANHAALYLEEDLHDQNYVWMASHRGLCRLDKRSYAYEYFPPTVDLPELGTDQVFNGLQSPDGYIYVYLESRFNGRLARFHKSQRQYELIDVSPAFPDARKTVHIRQLTFSPDSTIWMATADGLGRMDPHTGVFSLLTVRDGLPNDNLMGLATDKQGHIWIKGLQYISKYDPDTGSFWHFSGRKDMQEFNTVGSSVGEDGRIIFHGNNGFYAFYPDSIKLDTTSPKMVLTDFKVLSESRLFGTSPELLSHITLPHRDNVLSFEFAALHFGDPERNQYRYRLENFDQNWVDAGHEHKATYTNLRPGRYRFQVQASNPDGQWSDEDLVINLRIKPPLWLTWWAYCLYAILLSGSSYGFYRFQLARKLERAETKRIRELDHFKTRFFTNITHEFRTPLTIINGEAKELLKDSPLLHKPEVGSKAAAILRNGEQLLRLVDQMLDLAKMEQSDVAIQWKSGDIIHYLRYVTESFHSLASAKDIDLQFRADRESCIIEYDHEKMDKILTNLLSNALKFTPKGGEVAVNLEIAESTKGDRLMLAVRDSGIGIPATEIARIFDRFHQVESGPTRRGEGTGIGLALTKELVELLGGRIGVQSRVDEGTTFHVSLPVNVLDVSTFSQTQSSENPPIHHLTFGIADREKGASTPIAPANKEASRILIIEDNSDVQRYLVSCLAKYHRLEIASDGQEGIDKALAVLPDIIISDVMMPEKDGFEVCHTLKTDPRTNHIPVILLTAKADRDSKSEGIRKGADLYLPKPFDENQLLLWIDNRLHLHRTLQKKYTSPQWLAQTLVSTEEVASEEERLLQEFIRLVRENIENPDLTVPDIAKRLGYSESNLRRKLKSISGQSVKTYIVTIRMALAKELLTNTDLNVSEIAARVGYQEPGTFSRYFRKATGLSPSGFRKGERG